MGRKEQQKMCTNCDGRIPIEAYTCPYCAAELEFGAADEAERVNRQTLQDSLTSLYSPPYSAKNPGFMNTEEKKRSPFMKQTDQFKEIVSEKRFNSSISLGSPSIPMDSQEQQQADEKTSFWPILLLSMGANLLMLGMLQLLFSDNGALRLEWDSSYWFIYCLAAAPLVFLGFKKLNQLK